MILAVAIAVDNSNLCTGSQRSAQVPQQSDRLRNLMICFQQQHGMHRARGKKRVILFAKQSLDVVQLLLLRAIVDVADRLRVDIHRINCAAFAHSPRCPHGEPA